MLNIITKSNSYIDDENKHLEVIYLEKIEKINERGLSIKKVIYWEGEGVKIEIKFKKEKDKNF